MRWRSLMIPLVAAIGWGAGFCARAAAQQPVERATDRPALFRAVGALYGLDPQLLEAIATVESSQNADAISPKGAQGLMQLIPATARRFGVDDSFDPVQSALGAARLLDYLKRSLAMTPDRPAHLPELIAAYNAGEGAVAEYRGVPPYPETQQYVRRVLFAYLLDGAPLKAADQTTLLRQRTKPGHAHDKNPDPLQQMAEIRERRAAALLRSPEVPLVARMR
jgi:soluble lytic murein transglycosylase-like protein